MAWVAESRPCLAGPPAESPSTRNSSVLATSRERQSASLPGSDPLDSAPLRRVRSRALRAASRACIAWTPLLTIRRASAGCSSSQAPNCSLTACVTKLSTSLLPSLVLVWPSNCGSGTLTETMAVSPSRRSSPLGVSPFLMSLALRA